MYYLNKCCLFVLNIVYLFIPFIIDKDINFFIFLFSEEKNVQHIFKCNLYLFVKLITITGIFEMYSNKNKINFNRKNLRSQNNF